MTGYGARVWVQVRALQAIARVVRNHYASFLYINNVVYVPER